MSVDAFFAYARERQAILLSRRAGLPRSEWTSDPILQRYRFCNVHREDDRTTAWFREHVRGPLRAQPEVLLATVIFRWFNRITTGEAIFSQTDLGLETGGHPATTAWEHLRATQRTDVVHSAVVQYCGLAGPYVTGSYIIKTPDGMDKLSGVLWCVEQFMQNKFSLTTSWGPETLSWEGVADKLLDEPGTCSLEQLWSWLRQFPYLGDFMAYEIVTDLRHTALLDRAPDIMTWANPGPGATRGLGRVFEGDPRRYSQRNKERLNDLMQALLAASQLPQNWPQPVGDDVSWHTSPDQRLLSLTTRDPACWPAWDMRTVEHTLCEFDKYTRVRLGEGRPRQVFR